MYHYFVAKHGNFYTPKRGKIRLSVLIIGLVIILFFISVAWIRGYGASSIPAAKALISNASSSPVHTAVSGIASSVSEVASSLGSSNKPTTVAGASGISIGHSIGIAAGGGLSKLSPEDLNTELDEMNNLGIQWVRFDIEWGDVQYSSPNTSTWAKYDALVEAIAAHHMKALGIIVFTPQWARNPSCVNGVECPPENPATFATFAAEVAARYEPYGMHYWEIWNEPNSFNFWSPKVDCAGYTALLKATYPAIKKVDPNAVVITGGLAAESTNDVSMAPTDFLNCIYQNGGKNYFDAVADHPYSFPQIPSQVTLGAWAQMSLTSPSLRSIMIANGDQNKKIWITEFGAPTNGPDSHWYVSEAQQSVMATNAMNLYKTYSWAGPFFWYSLKDGGTSTDTNENFFGLIRADNSLKPAFTTLKNIISTGL